MASIFANLKSGQGKHCITGGSGDVNDKHRPTVTTIKEHRFTTETVHPDNAELQKLVVPGIHSSPLHLAKHPDVVKSKSLLAEDLLHSAAVSRGSVASTSGRAVLTSPTMSSGAVCRLPPIVAPVIPLAAYAESIDQRETSDTPIQPLHNYISTDQIIKDKHTFLKRSSELAVPAPG